jgi:ribonuclease HI
VVAYCDGSCPVTDGDGGWGYVIVCNSETWEECGGVTRDATNNTMELEAAYQCLRHIYDLRFEHNPVLVCSDSQYIVNGVHQWRKAWERNGFHKVKNVDQWKGLFTLVDKFDFLAFAWVRGHKGVWFNEKADQLADTGRRNTVSRSTDRGR